MLQHSKTNGSKPCKQKGVRIRKKSLTTAVKEPTPLPESLASWEDGKAEKVVDCYQLSHPYCQIFRQSYQSKWKTHGSNVQKIFATR